MNAFTLLSSLVFLLQLCCLLIAFSIEKKVTLGGCSSSHLQSQHLSLGQGERKVGSSSTPCAVEEKDVIEHACNMSTREVKARGLGVQDQPQLQSKFEGALQYLRPYLRKQQKVIDSVRS